MTQKTGQTALQGLAKEMCKLILRWFPVMKRVYPENVALHLAIESADIACKALFEELEGVKNYGD